MGEELLEAEAIEEPLAGEPADEELGETRPLPQRSTPSELDVWRGDVRQAAIVAGAGVVAGAATVAVVRAVKGAAQPSRGRSLRRKGKKDKVVASRSFLVDVHVLGR